MFANLLPRFSRPREKQLTYRPLEFPDSIRVIQFSVTNGRLCGRLKHVRLSDRPSYRALSYVWGPTEPRRILVIDEQVHYITPNLADFLDSHRGSLPLPALWIDAICIDQGSRAEKSVQVQMMRRIYESSVGVVIWLGKGNDETDQLIRSMHGYSQHLQQRIKRLGTSEAVFADPKWPEEMGFRSPSGEVRDREGWERLGRFFDECQWWNRMWTVQEYLPPVEKYFLCRKQVFQPQVLTDTLMIVDQLERHPGFGFLRLAGFAIPHRAELFIRTFHDDTRPRMSVYEVLTKLRERHASNPRDKVFAALGLVDPQHLTDRNLTINYSLSPEQVMTKVAEYLLQTNRNLDFLEAALRPAIPGCPSWVPDWSSHTVLKGLPKLRINNEGQILPLYSPWSGSIASGWEEHPPTVVKRRSGAQLHLHGVILDTVTWLGENLGNEGNALTLRSWFDHSLQFRGKYLPTGEPMIQAMVRTIRMDAEPRDRVGTNEVYTRGLRNQQHLSSMSLADAVHELMKADGNDMRSQILAGAKIDLIRHRRFAETRDGFVGIVPPHTRVDDKVCAVAGGRVLYVVREIDSSPSHYYFVGESYFHGLIDGEWRRNDKMQQPQEIILAK